MNDPITYQVVFNLWLKTEPTKKHGFNLKFKTLIPSTVERDVKEMINQTYGKEHGFEIISINNLSTASHA